MFFLHLEQALTEVDDPLADLGVEPYTWQGTHAAGKPQMPCHFVAMDGLT